MSTLSFLKCHCECIMLFFFSFFPICFNNKVIIKCKMRHFANFGREDRNILKVKEDLKYDIGIIQR